ncbi:bifunctional aspartate kinase/homoserine dehydrogenase II [Arsukibacterium sp.]|uniref:bifunctional aspartate kinase/homoserine dehydrogenase II n=1 Tax=Arsukibacterium sp. TaxID=1977258 RepID=UPI002FDB667A
MTLHSSDAAVTRSHNGCNPALEVHKFGGSSLADAGRFAAVADIVCQQTAESLWLVVSAPGDTTDTLLALLALAAEQRDVKPAIAALALQLNELVQSSLPATRADKMLCTVKQWLDDLPGLLAAQQQVAVLSIGERFSALLLSQLLQQRGRQSSALDARDFILVQQQQVCWQGSAALLERQQLADINVVTGFIARNDLGEDITLGRNGSDFSATILGRILVARCVTIWTDVPAIFSADPRKVSAAVPYAEVNWQQACELAALGNPVLHARTLAPLTAVGAELVVRSSFSPQQSGCRVKPQAARRHFITELNCACLVSFHDQIALSATQLSLQLQQPVIELPHTGTGQSWLLPKAALPAALAALQQAGAHPLSDTASYYALAWLKAGAISSQKLAGILKTAAIKHHYENDQLAVWLFKQELAVTILDEIHHECVKPTPQLQLVVAGSGNVGAEFLRLLPRQQQRLAGSLDLQLAGVINSRQAWLGKQLDSHYWAEGLANSSHYQWSELLAYLKALPSPKVLVDITPSRQFAERYTELVAAGCHIISANKQGVTLPSSQYQQLKQQFANAQLSWLSNTTVGAGIPVQRVLQELLDSGDSVRQISGVFSGTLSWLLCKYDGKQAFTDYLLQAQQLGLTEPDPRDDLSGADVQRKLLVLARELGLTLELEDIRLSPLLAANLAQDDWASFWSERALLDQQMAKAFQAAEAEGKVLRYAAKLSLTATGVSAEVALQAVLPDHPLAALAPCDNIFVVESDWYSPNPLVLKGPGAGREVTAGGLHADLAVLARQLQSF